MLRLIIWGVSTSNLLPYYEADLKDGRIDPDGAQELLDCMWIKIAELSLFQDEVTAQFAAGYCITVQVTAGGVDQYGNDAVNPLSYMVIQATMDVRFKEPNMSIRYNIAKNPDSFLRKGAEGIRMGLSMPAVYHDDAGIRMMLNKGVPLSEAWTGIRAAVWRRTFRKNETVYGYGRCEYGRYH